MQIKNRNGQTIYTDDNATMRETVEAAVRARADLAGADLTGANLTEANLIHADLAGADLAGANLVDANLDCANLASANLTGADLAGADLAGANLTGANLVRVNLIGANLGDADLTGADLVDADLAGANLSRADLDADLAGANLAGAFLIGANLAGADLASANLTGANLDGANLACAKNVPKGIEALAASAPQTKECLPPRSSKDPAERLARYRCLHPEVPVVEDLDRKILAAIEGGGGLEMSLWHTCETTHCLAGWAAHLAGERGMALEAKRGPHMAGAMIFRVSTGKAPHFFATNERALADLRRRVAALNESGQTGT